MLCNENSLDRATQLFNASNFSTSLGQHVEDQVQFAFYNNSENKYGQMVTRSEIYTMNEQHVTLFHIVRLTDVSVQILHMIVKVKSSFFSMIGCGIISISSNIISCVF
jgi:hypothetical protein